MPLGPIEALRVFTADFGRSLPFYRDVLGLVPLQSDAGVAILDTGQAKLILEQVDSDAAEAAALVGRFVGVSFTVPDVEAAHRSLTARGVDFDGTPERQPWGGVLAHLRDPDGNILTLVQYPD